MKERIAMAIKLNSVKCPECGATLSIESGLATFFCTYCGAKIIATNENEYTYRLVDDAKVKQAETDRIVRMKELELEEREKYNTKKKSIIAYVMAFLFVVVGIGLLK